MASSTTTLPPLSLAPHQLTQSTSNVGMPLSATATSPSNSIDLNDTSISIEQSKRNKGGRFCHRKGKNKAGEEKRPKSSSGDRSGNVRGRFGLPRSHSGKEEKEEEKQEGNEKEKEKEPIASPGIESNSSSSRTSVSSEQSAGALANIASKGDRGYQPGPQSRQSTGLTTPTSSREDVSLVKLTPVHLTSTIVSPSTNSPSLRPISTISPPSWDSQNQTSAKDTRLDSGYPFPQTAPRPKRLAHTRTGSTTSALGLVTPTHDDPNLSFGFPLPKGGGVSVPRRVANALVVLMSVCIYGTAGVVASLMAIVGRWWCLLVSRVTGKKCKAEDPATPVRRRSTQVIEGKSSTLAQVAGRDNEIPGVKSTSVFRDVKGKGKAVDGFDSPISVRTDPGPVLRSYPLARSLSTSSSSSSSSLTPSIPPNSTPKASSSSFFHNIFGRQNSQPKKRRTLSPPTTSGLSGMHYRDLSTLSENEDEKTDWEVDGPVGDEFDGQGERSVIDNKYRRWLSMTEESAFVASPPETGSTLLQPTLQVQPPMLTLQQATPEVTAAQLRESQDYRRSSGLGSSRSLPDLHEEMKQNADADEFGRQLSRREKAKTFYGANPGDSLDNQASELSPKSRSKPKRRFFSRSKASTPSSPIESSTTTAARTSPRPSMDIPPVSALPSPPLEGLLPSPTSSVPISEPIRDPSPSNRFRSRHHSKRSRNSVPSMEMRTLESFGEVYTVSMPPPREGPRFRASPNAQGFGAPGPSSPISDSDWS